MWCKIEAMLSAEVVDNVVNESRNIASRFEDRHFVEDGKSFFADRLLLRNRINSSVNKAINLSGRISNPAIHHCFLLYKSAGGPATSIHQDRYYWLNIEDVCTMFTVWIALGDIDDSNGALMLNPDNQVGLDEFFSNYRCGKLLNHFEDQYGGGGFSKRLSREDENKFRTHLKVQSARSGDAIIFDAFEPHCSTANMTNEARLAMKIGYGDANSMRYYLASLNDLPQ